MTFESVNGIFSTGISINTNEVYDLRGRHENDEIYDGASTASIEGATILSSAPNSNNNDRSAGDGGSNNINIHLADDIALSLSPSMVNSSIFIPGSSSTIGSSLSDDMISLISSCDSAISSNTTTRQPDDALSNVGRSLALASIDDDATYCSEKESVMVGVVDWWDRLKTDDDWNSFRIKANEYLNVLIAEEIKNKTQHSTGTEYNVDKTSTIKEGMSQQNQNEQNQGLLQWLQGICDSINKTISGITSRDESTKTKHVNTLMKEIVDIKQQLDQLPPLPPSLPEELSLDDMPSESRDMLIEYSENLDEWKGKIMPRREDLLAKYVKCQEKLLSLIIDTEEQVFYRNNNSSFGSMNDDGYVEVIDKTSPQWDSVNDVLVMRSRCHATTLFIAAFAFGAGLFISLRSKRS